MHQFKVEDETVTQNDRPLSNLSASTLLSDLPIEFINSNQEMSISSPSEEDHSYQYLEQEEENSNTQDAPIIPADTQEARPRIHEDNRQKQDEQEANCYIRNSAAAAARETIPIETVEMRELKQIVIELQQLYPDYAKCFLSCQRCVSFGILRPHCKCSGLHECIQMCPDLTNCTKDKRQLSHCPTCFNIGKGISRHKTLSSIIDVYVCANCAAFITYWKQEENKGKLEKLTCESKLDRTGNCLQDRQLGERCKPFCTWCRLKLMQLLGFKMTDEVQKALQHTDPEQRKFLQSFDSDQNNSESNGLTTVNGTENSGQDCLKSVSSGVEELVVDDDVSGLKRRSEEILPVDNEETINDSFNCLRLDAGSTPRKKKRDNEFVADENGRSREVRNLFLDACAEENCDGDERDNQDLVETGVMKTQLVLNSCEPINEYAASTNLSNVQLEEHQATSVEVANLNGCEICTEDSALVADQSAKNAQSLLKAGNNINVTSFPDKLPDAVWNEDIDFERLICIAKAFHDVDEHLLPLHVAIVNGDAAAVNTFLSYGADPNEKTQKGRTPLFYTLIARIHCDQVQCIFRSLKNKGADMSITDIYGYTHYDYWFLLRLTHEKFEDAKNNIRMTNKRYSASDSLRLQISLLERGSFNVEKIVYAIKRSDSDLSDLHIAAKDGKYYVAMAVLMSDPDLISRKSQLGRTALHFAAMSAKNEYACQVYQLLIHEGADPWLTDSFGFSALDYLRQQLL